MSRPTRGQLSLAAACTIILTASAEPSLAQQAAQPAQGAAELPAVEVVAKKKAAPAKKKAAKAAPAKKAAPVQAAAPSPEPGPDAPPAPGNPGSGTGPVEGYSAKSSATGTKTDTPLSETPQSISVIGKDQIQDQGAQTVQDSVRYTAGVIADAYGFDSRSDGGLIRGLNAPRYVDGMRQNYGYYVNTVPLEIYNLERVEVLRGPASVLYGQSSAGGLFNIVTKRPQEETSREIGVEYGSFDRKVIRTDMTGALTADGKWLYRLVALARESDTQVDYVDNDRLLFAPSLTYRPTADTSITFLSSYQQDRSGSTQQFMPHIGTRYASPQGFIPVNRFVGEPSQDRYDTDGGTASLLIDHRFNDVLSIHQGIRYGNYDNTYRSQYPFAFADPLAETIYRVKYSDDTRTDIFTTDTNLVAKFSTGPIRHKILGGIDYSYYQETGRSGYALNFDRFNLYDPVYGLPGSFVPVPLVPENKVSQDQLGIYVQDQMRLGPWLVTAGLRQDWITNESDPLTGATRRENNDALTGRVGLMYELPFGVTPYVSYSESFDPVPGTRVVGGGFAKPVEGEQVEAGVKYETPKGDLTITGAIFDITEKNRIAAGNDPLDPTASSQIGEASVRGFEFELKGQITRNVKTLASYTYLDTEVKDGNPAEIGKQIESVPTHLASLWAVYSFDTSFLKGFSIGGGVRYVGKSWDSAETIDTPAYTLFDAMVSYETPDWRWSLNASNLEDERYLTTCLNRGDCFIGQSRTITTGLTYKF